MGFVATVPTTQKFAIGFAISKVDKDTRIVSGIATAEVPDKQGDIVGFDGACRAFGKWAGNVRFQHDAKRPIGKSIQWTPIPDQKAIAVDVQISRSREGDDALKDVEDGILRGFSIQGNITRAAPIVQKADDGAMKNYRFIHDYDQDELSLVDNPACPVALISMVKSVDGALLATDALLPLDDPAPETPAVSESFEPTSETTVSPPTTVIASPGAVVGGWTAAQIQAALDMKLAAENAKTFGGPTEEPYPSAVSGLENGTGNGTATLHKAAPVAAAPPPAAAALPPGMLQTAMKGTLSEAMTARRAMEEAAAQPAPVVTPRVEQQFFSKTGNAALDELRASLAPPVEKPLALTQADLDALVDARVETALAKVAANIAKAGYPGGPRRTTPGTMAKDPTADKPDAKPDDKPDATDKDKPDDDDFEKMKQQIVALAYTKGADAVSKLPDDWKRKVSSADTRAPSLAKDASVPKPGQGYRSATVGYPADFVLDPATYRFLNPQDVPLAVGSMWKAKDPDAAKAVITNAAYAAGPRFVEQLPPDWRRVEKSATPLGRVISKCLDDYGWRGSPDVQTAAKLLSGLDTVLASETREAATGGSDDEDRSQLDSLRNAVSSVLTFLTSEMAEYYGAVGEDPVRPEAMSYAAGQSADLRKSTKVPDEADSDDVQQMHDTAVRLGAVCQEQSAPTEEGATLSHPSDNPAIKSAADTADEEIDDVNADQIIKAVNANTTTAIKNQLGTLATKDDLRKAVEVMSQLDARLAKVEAQPAYDPTAPAANGLHPVEKALGSESSGDAQNGTVTVEGRSFTKADIDKLDIEWRTTTDQKKRQSLGFTLAKIDMALSGQL